ncbi:MAG: hypothetical protein HWE07_13245 [Cytophagia bacterium]|nr:hypothetical protein [Cytophagia bacterium]
MSPQELDVNTKILIIRINHSNAGFFAYLSFVLNQILYCEKNNLLPVVYFGPWSVDGPNAYHDPQKGENMWDYHFEPVAGYTYKEIQALIKEPNHPITEKNLIYLEDDVLSYIHAGDPDSIYNYPYGYYTDLEESVNSWYDRQRKKAHKLIEKYIHIRKEIIDETDDFVKKHFEGYNVLGVHIRGTDKGSASEAEHISNIIPPEKYYPYIQNYIEQHPSSKIFLATDQSQFVEEMKIKYPGRILTQSTILSDSRVNSFQKADGNNYQKGKEVLLDCLLLSRCNYLLKCESAVGEYALYFNADLESLDLNELSGRANAYQKLKTFFLVEPYIFIKALAQKVKNQDKGISDLFWFLLTGYPLIRRLYDRLEATQFSGSSFWRTLFFLKKYISLLRNKEEIPFQQVRQMAIHSNKRKGSQYYSFREARGKKYLEIRTDGDPQAAFFAQFLYVLQQLRFAEANCLTPVVNLNHSYNYYFDQNHKSNVWENYFEPVANISSSRLDKIDPRTITFLRPEEQRRLFLGEGDQPPVNYDVKAKQWWLKQREMGARLTSKYIRVRPEILNKVNDFFEANIKGHKVLGMHLRGTDKSVRFDGKPHEVPEIFRRIIPPEEYFPFIDRFLIHYPEGKLFVATDQKQFLLTLLERYGKRIIHTNAIRSRTKKAVFSRSGSGYERGVEVLTDTLLLSRCDYLIKCMSNVGEVAVYFNPKIPVIDTFYPFDMDELDHFFQK